VSHPIYRDEPVIIPDPFGTTTRPTLDQSWVLFAQLEKPVPYAIERTPDEFGHDYLFDPQHHKGHKLDFLVHTPLVAIPHSRTLFVRVSTCPSRPVTLPRAWALSHTH
jgi:hypothetical protein